MIAIDLLLIIGHVSQIQLYVIVLFIAAALTVLLMRIMIARWLSCSNISTLSVHVRLGASGMVRSFAIEANIFGPGLGLGLVLPL